MPLAQFLLWAVGITVNSPGVKNWTALMAAQFGLSAPCAAANGLDGDPAQGFSVIAPAETMPAVPAMPRWCASEPIRLHRQQVDGGANVTLGFLTVPVVQQIQNHLNSNVATSRMMKLSLLWLAPTMYFFS